MTDEHFKQAVAVLREHGHANCEEAAQCWRETCVSAAHEVLAELARLDPSARHTQVRPCRR
jgi:hypothetical protein